MLLRNYVKVLKGYGVAQLSKPLSWWMTAVTQFFSLSNILQINYYQVH